MLFMNAVTKKHISCGWERRDVKSGVLIFVALAVCTRPLWSISRHVFRNERCYSIAHSFQQHLPCAHDPYGLWHMIGRVRSPCCSQCYDATQSHINALLQQSHIHFVYQRNVQQSKYIAIFKVVPVIDNMNTNKWKFT